MVVQLAGPTRAFSRDSWFEDVHNAAQDSPDAEIVVDMSAVERIQSRDLSDLVRLHLDFKQQERKLILENMLEEIARVFEVTRLDRVIEIRGQFHA